MSHFLQRAIELAIENVNQGGDPFGAVVVSKGEIIGEGVNTSHHLPDISGRAEMNAIRQAQKHLGRIDLSDCIIYASGYPCPMCFGAITMSNIHKVVYSNSLEDAAEAGMGLSEDIYHYLSGNNDAIDLSIERVPIDAGDVDSIKHKFMFNQ